MEQKTKSRNQQSVAGSLNLKEVQEISPDLRIKVAVARDCRVLVSRVFELAADQREVNFDLKFSHESGKPIGARLLVGPDVPDEQFRSLDLHQVWLPAKSFVKGVAEGLVLNIPDRLYRLWLIFCRTYTLRGRVVCRRWVWDPIEQRFVICDAPVRGAKVTAFDVDCFWWWCRRDPVGSDFTDLNGNFEIRFRWCCWWWRPWILGTWRLDPVLVDRIRELLARTPLTIPIPLPDPVPDFSMFERLVADTRVLRADAPAAGEDRGGESFARLGEELVRRLPPAPELEALHVWPWWPRFDCRPDIVFQVTQDCGDGEQVVYTENRFQTRWNIDTVLDGVTLVANENACCGRFCCSDPPDEDCLVFHGVGCGGYPVEVIEQDVDDPLVGYAFPGTHDRPFGGTIRLLAVFGDNSGVDFYKVQRRRIAPLPTGWEDLPENEVGSFNRLHWTGWPPPLWKTQVVALQEVDGQKVLKTTNRFREENPDVDTAVDPTNDDWLALWVTSNGAPEPGLTDGVYELRVVGYRYDAANDRLVDQKVMALCPRAGGDVDPARHSALRLRLDNRVVSSIPGSVHLSTTEPDCDYPNVCAVVKNEGQPDQECVGPCGVVRLSADDTLTVHFQATDSDGHLQAYSLTAHWEESQVFNILSVGTLAADPDPLVGPTYGQTFLGAQAVHRAALPPANPEHDRPFWYGGHFKVTVTVGQLVPATDHRAFETCCAYLLRLRVWKRTTNGCTGPYDFHFNHCEFSFTVIREDLIGDPNHPSCSELCPPKKVKQTETATASPVE